MSAAVVNEVRRTFYLDSVALMRLSRTIGAMDGVEEAALMMGTPANKRIMAEAGVLAAEGEAATAGDLVIAVRAISRDAAAAALARATRLLEEPAAAGTGGASWRPRTIRTAVKVAPRANLALISVPGAFAAAEARRALHHGLHVMIFSDNVPIDEEVRLKREARALGRLVMGPDCGTAIVGGVPLAFANRVPRGDIAIIGASGTGIQEISCLIARGGRGISQAIGVGGHDLDEKVGGISTLMAIDALEADPETRHVVLVSKPPAPSVTARVLERIGAGRKTYTVCLIGAEGLEGPKNASVAPTLKAAAEAALGGAPVAPGFDARAAAGTAPAGRGAVRGLFSGGTLCAEAQVVFRSAGVPVASNVPIPGVAPWAEGDAGHVLVDLGADAYTRGRPHPMIDPAVRDAAFAAALADPAVGVILFDLVIGFGAAENPARHVAAALDGRPKDGPLLVASVTGTDEDRQRRADQVATLEGAGVLVAPCNADAAALALACLNAGR